MTILEKLGLAVVLALGVLLAGVLGVRSIYNSGFDAGQSAAIVSATKASLDVALAQQRTLIAQHAQQIAEATARAQVEATRIATGETIITEVQKVSAPARDCRLDQPAADGLNGVK